MRREAPMCRLLVVLLFALIVVAVARADEATDLRDRAIKAQAKDPADLKKFRVHTFKAKGVSKLKDPDHPEPATWDVAAAWPANIRLTWELGDTDKKTRFTLISTGDRGWQSGTNNPTQELMLEVLNDVRTDAYAIWVSTLTTLTDAETTLTYAGKSKLNDQPVLGLKVSRRPWPDITLYFDEKTSLLRKMAYRSREAGVLLNKEFLYDGYKEVNGLMVATKHRTIIQGREIANWTEVEYAFPDKIDPKTFEKP
jgi:hypothetical protein